MKIKSLKTEMIISLLFLGLGLLATFPLIFKMRSHIYGYPGDPLGTIYDFWWWKYAWMNKLGIGYTYFLNAPFGREVAIRGGQSLYTFLPVILLSREGGEIFTYNLFILLSFPLSAFTMYLLAYHLTRDRVSSVVAGLIYSLSPYHFSHSFQHLTLAAIQWMPLYLLFLFKLREERSYKNALICGFLFSLVALDVYYYGYFMIVATLLFLLFSRRRVFASAEGSCSPSRLKSLMLMLTALLVASAIIIPWLFPVLKTLFIGSEGTLAASSGYVRPFKDLFYYSAKPLGYLLPSSDHPVLGRITRSFLGTIFYGHSSTEHTLYLGYVPLVLAGVAIRNWRRKRKSLKLKGEPGQDSGEGFFIALALVGIIFSQSPYWQIGSLKVFFPSYFMFRILPMFRVYARFGIVVMLAVSLLAGMGLKVILSRAQTRRRKVVTVSLLVPFILFEFLNVPPFRVTDVSQTPPVYEWLAAEPGDFIVAEYPLVLSQDCLFYQRIHRKRLVNGAVPGTESEEIRKRLLDISHPQTPGLLASLGVEYVIVHLDKYVLEEEATGIIGEVPDLSRQAGLELVKKFGEVEVYRVTTKPVEPRGD